MAKDFETWKKKFKNLSAEERKAMLQELDAVETEEKALRELDGHPLVEAVHKAMEKAAKETETDVPNVRMAEIRRYVVDVPTFERDVSKFCEQWKKENATHRHPDDPDKTWYSPDCSGNAPKWIKDEMDTKPDRKDEAKYQAWVDKVNKKFRVENQVTDKAA